MKVDLAKEAWTVLVFVQVKVVRLLNPDNVLGFVGVGEVLQPGFM